MFLNVSKSLTKSKLLIASTLFSSFKTSSMTVDKELPVDPTPTKTLFSIDVSAKFFNPAGCKMRFTGFTNLSHSTVLFTEYDKFW